tara:strand:+ start:8191 stop:8403 length:213 start_codon:yes stop_codon:yes gene_type:complete
MNISGNIIHMNEFRYMNLKNYFLKEGFDDKAATEKALKIMEPEITIRKKRRLKHLSVREIRMKNLLDRSV